MARSQAGRIAVALLTATAVCVLGWLFAQPAAATPYPPTPPCLLSWQGASTSSVTLTGSGLGGRQSVDVVLHPQSTRVGSWTTNSSGSFQAHVALPAGGGSTEWLTAVTRSTSCTTKPPGSGGSTSPPATSPSTSPSSGPSATGSTPGSAPGGTGPGGGGAVVGTGGGESPGTQPSATSGAPSSRHPSPSSSAPVGPTSPTPTSQAPSRHPDLAGPVADLGLPASLVITIAALLLLAGGLAVIFLTRRAG